MGRFLSLPMLSQLKRCVLKHTFSVGSTWGDMYIYLPMTSWSLFLMYAEYYPKISKSVEKYAFLNALICFSPGVHQISPLFWQFWISNLTIFWRISKLCAFWVYTKYNQNTFSWMLLPTPMLSLRVMVSVYSRYCGNWKSQKKIVNFLIITLFFTQNHKIGYIPR